MASWAGFSHLSYPIQDRESRSGGCFWFGGFLVGYEGRGICVECVLVRTEEGIRVLRAIIGVGYKSSDTGAGTQTSVEEQQVLLTGK